MPEIVPPDIPEGLVLFTRLPSTIPYRVAELHVTYTEGDQVTGIVQLLSVSKSRYRETDDIKVLRDISETIYENFKSADIYRFNKQLQKWTRSLV